MSASKPTDIHRHLCNAVPLVWGSLRLIPISLIRDQLCDKVQKVYTDTASLAIASLVSQTQPASAQVTFIIMLISVG